MKSQFLDNELVVLVDESDNEIGLMPKLEAHQRGLLHRAFSVFVYNSSGELLLQRRADEKYHSPGLWSNTCCSHPRKGETAADAARRRLQEEMGMECPLTEAFSFTYRSEFSNGLIEHEFDHVFFGSTNELPKSNRAEVSDWKYVSEEELARDIEKNPGSYTEWLKIVFDRVAGTYAKQKEPKLY